MLFKNLNLGMRIALLEKMNTHNKYIFIKRNPFYTAQSLLIARRKNNNDIETWWSVKPPGYKYIQSFNPIKQVVRQVYNIEKQITKDLGEYVNPQDVLTVNYEDLIQGNLKLEHLRTFIGSAESKQENSNVQLINGNVSRLEKPVLDQIKHEVEKLDWKGYKSQI